MIKEKKNIYYIALTLLPIFFFLPLLVSASIMTAGDGIGYEAQFEVIRLALQKGEFPQWTRFIANGTPFAADIQNKVFYPLVYLCLLFPRHLDFKIFYILHIILSQIFTFNLFKKLTGNYPVSFYGAIITGFCNVVILRQDHINILCTIVWIPLLVQLLLRLFETNRKIYAIYLGLAMALQFLAGFPQITFYCDLIIFFLYIYLSLRKRTGIRDFILNGISLLITYLGVAAVQILPLAELMMYSGRSNITYEYFAGGSSDLRLLLNLFNPVFWGEWGRLLYEGLEFPTDMYIGIIPLTLFIYSLIYCRKKKEVRALTCTAGITFILACACNNIPVLGKILYKLPLLNSFRTLSRFDIFFSISLLWLGVIGLKHIVEQRKYKPIAIITIAVLAIYTVLCISFIALGRNGFFKNPEWNEYYTGSGWYYKSFIMLAIVIIFWMVAEVCARKNRDRSFVVVIAILIVCVWDTYFFNIDASANIFRQSGMLNNGTHEEIFDTEEITYLENIPEKERGRYFVSYESWDDLENTSWGLRVNGNIYHQCSSLQSYITFNNPLLLQLCSADYGMMMNIDSVMAITNPTFLQMLSTKYIIADNRYSYAWNGSATIFEQYPFIRDDLLANDIEVPVVLAQEYTHTLYLHINVADEGGLLCINLGGETLYSENLGNGDNYIKYTLNKNSSAEPLRLQFNDVDMKHVEILGIRIEENYDVVNSFLFREVFKNSKYSIIESLFAQELLFSPQKVVCVENCEEYIAGNKEAIDFVNTSYIQNGMDMDLSDVDTQIEIVDIGTNSITAHVYASGDTWINYSQSPYNGWCVFIDGVKQETIAVNGLIQGTPIKAGYHDVTFRFSSPTLLCGAWISVIACLSVMLIIIREKFGSETSKY